MRVLLVGSGGREHALAWKIAQSPRLERLFIAPGNPGTAELGQNVPVGVDQIDALVDVARREQIDLVVVGPEAPLAVGLTDALQAAGIAVFGPTAAAAQIESSKAFAKQIMQEAGVPTAEAHVFSDPEEARRFVQASGSTWVVKVDGLASGKGVIVPDSLEATDAAITQLSEAHAGMLLVLEELLSGPEVSLIALCDGKRLLPLPPAQDHKRLLDGDLGPNTGGMGAYAPAVNLPHGTVTRIVDTILQPVIDRLAERGTPFCGALFAGLMLTADGPKVLEFNARFGDPETQVLMPLIEGDLLAALLACAQGRLAVDMLSWGDGAAACVVLAAEGYPEAPRRGTVINGLEAFSWPGVLVFHAGTAWQDGELVTAGGRVLCVTGVGPDLRAVLDMLYDAIDDISFAGMQYRHDIGAQAVRHR